MILLLPAILLTLVVILWITFSPVGPRFGRPPVPDNGLMANAEIAKPVDSDDDSNVGRRAETVSMRDSDSEYEEHLETRLETTHVPIGSMTGIQGLSSSVSPLRERTASLTGEEREV